MLRNLTHWFSKPGYFDKMQPANLSFRRNPTLSAQPWWSSGTVNPTCGVDRRRIPSGNLY